MFGAKKLVIVLTISFLVTEVSIKDTLRPLKRVSCIHYLLSFWKIYVKLSFINLGSEVNTITPTYIAKLSFKIQKTNIKAQKINNSIHNTFGMVLTDFQVEDKLNEAQSFQETFIIANNTLKVILGMFFLTFSNVDIEFA